MLPERVDCPRIVEWTTDGDGRLCDIDSGWLQLTGQGAESAKGEGWFDAIHDDDRDRMKAALREAAQSQRSVRILARLRRADGQYRRAIALGAPRRDQQGAPVGYGGWIVDLEDRPGPEFDETRQRLEAVIDAAPVGLCYTSGANCDRLIGNRTLLSQFEFPASQEISTSAIEPQAAGRQVRYVRNGRELTKEELPLQTAVREARTIEPQEMEVRLPSGRKWLIEASAAPIFAPDGRLLGGVAVTLDVTERKRNLDALRASEERFRSLFETSRDGIATVDMSGRILEANPAYQKMLGYSLDELKCLTFRDLTPAAWREMEEKVVQEHILPSGESEEYEKEYIRKDGSVFPVSLRAWTVVDGDGRVVAMRAFVRDITERKSAEAALRVSELRYRTLMEATRAVTWSCPPSGLNVEPQPEWMAFTGQTAAEMRGEGWSDVVHPDDRPAAAAKWRDAVERAAPFISEHRIRRRDGEWRWIRAQAAPIRDAKGEIVEFFGMNLDITDRKAAEDALRQSERRFRQVAESLPQFIWTCQADGSCWSAP
jgi:PAS domain S-box-containing protein